MTRKQSAERTVALCYIRQSKTRDETDTNSPERQRANIAEVCERNGWTPEWYQDAEGHKSGRYVHNRPGWLQLKKRLGDPDVIVLVANDLSRLHRKGWRVGDLLDQMNELDIHLVLAAPGREVDTTTPQGRMFLQFGAIIDEYMPPTSVSVPKTTSPIARSVAKALASRPSAVNAMLMGISNLAVKAHGCCPMARIYVVKRTKIRRSRVLSGKAIMRPLATSSTAHWRATGNSSLCCAIAS